MDLVFFLYIKYNPMAINENNYVADALRRENYNLFHCLKILICYSNILFLKECKRRDLIPKGLRTKNKLISTYPCQRANILQKRQSKQWLNLAINQSYSRLRHWQTYT